MPMMLPSWREQIEAISTNLAWADCEIEIHDPSLVASTYDAETNTYTSTGNSLVACVEGVRVVGIGRDRSTSGASTYDAGGVKQIRISFPFAAYAGRVNRDWFIELTSVPRNPAMEGYVYVVTSDNLNSNRASHVVEAVIDLEKSVGS